VAETGIRPFIPWAEPRYWGNEEAYALDALRSQWISGGPYVDRLERDISAFCGSPHVLATSNGTTAIQGAFLGIGLGAGDEIVVPGFTFMAAANIALHMGAVPVFADVDPDTWLVTAETIEKVLTERTKAIVPVHTYGNVCDMQPILELAAARSIFVIEDAAEALGSLYRDRQAGTIAEIGTYSFHATKVITTGEGGAIATRIPEIAERIALYRSHGVKSRRYFHDVPGHNFRLTNLQAAIGCAQLEQVDALIEARRRVYRSYCEAIGNVAGVRLQTMTPDCEPIVWALAVALDPRAFPQGRDAVIEAMRAKGIETRPGFYAASEMAHIYGPQDLPVATAIGRSVISLPSSPTVTDAEIAHIVAALADAATG
jgi:perosamine synthetase